MRIIGEITKIENNKIEIETPIGWKLEEEIPKDLNFKLSVGDEILYDTDKGTKEGVIKSLYVKVY